MAIIPEEFAVVWTVMMALGAWRLSQQQVLTRQPQAIEALGTTNVLCVDKTGTLTHNRMELLALATPDARLMLEPGGVAGSGFLALLEVAARASVGDGLEPMDRAILRLHQRSATARLGGALKQRRGVSAENPYVVHGWQLENGQGMLAVKGSPEAILSLCNVTATATAQQAHEAQQLAAQGLRVLAVAHGPWNPGSPIPASPQRLDWAGLIGFLDPLRDDVPEAVEICRRAGIRVVMITGDAAATAAAVAGMARLDVGRVLTGNDLKAMDDSELDAATRDGSVFARVTPQQKLRVVRSLQRQGAVVAMTGDGVNDAIALRAADIGVAMGRRGTDVAREAAALVLLDDSFAALVHAVRLGRRIFINLKHSVTYLLAVHVPIIAVSLIPVLFHGPVLLLPLHVVFLELIIDPACSLVFEAEPEPKDCMTRMPRPANVKLISLSGAWRAIAIGALAALGVGAIQVLGHLLDWPTPWMRFAALSSLIIANLAMLVWFLGVVKTPSAVCHNRALLWLLLSICTAFALVLLIGPLARQFGLPLGADNAAAIAILLTGTLAAAYRLWTTRAVSSK
jgi:P-type Ca2+ transporter type 2C